MNVLSLFDGMSCGRLALERAGVKVTKYYRSEVDRYASTIAKKNYPDSIDLGGVKDFFRWDIDWGSIDLVLAGSPCQGFSFAGKQLAFDDPRSKLFFVFIEILNHIRQKNPNVKFLLENVKMSKTNLGVISKYLGVEPVFIDSSVVSPAYRQRYYWANWEITKPGPKESTFQSVLEKDEARCKKAFALTRTYYKKGGESTRRRNFSKSQRPIAWIDDDNTRWLSPLECERLMTVPDGYTEGVSNTQRYMMLGNGWTIDVVAHILRQMV